MATLNTNGQLVCSRSNGLDIITCCFWVALNCVAISSFSLLGSKVNDEGGKDNLWPRAEM